MGEIAFSYKEIDPEGLDTLEAVAQAHNFNRWMYQTIRPYNNGRVLEIGSGIGNISQFFLEDGAPITLSDIRPQYCTMLAKRFADKFPNFEGAPLLDIVSPDFDEKFQSYFGTFDSIFALNVVEHIENDELALANCKKLLCSGGKITILVPAFQALYNRFDEELFHYRRYDKQSLTALFKRTGYKVETSFYFNSVGVLGWFVSGKIQRNKTIPEGQMKLFDKLVPLVRLTDKIIGRSFGLSVLVVGRKGEV